MAYVFVEIAGQTCVAAIVDYQAGQSLPYRFRYGQSYLNNPKAFALDPLHLPLTDTVSHWQSLPGALSDACPDDWGKRVYTSLNGTVPNNDIEYLIGNVNLGAGMLSFSTTAEPPRFNPTSQNIYIESLDEIAMAYQAIEQGLSTPKHLHMLLQHGSSLGGARPKTALHKKDGSQWLVKLSRAQDLFNNVIAEYAAMQLAAEASIQVPNVELHELANGPVLLVQRFDREPNGARLHYLSAMTLVGPNKFAPSQFNDAISYSNVAYKMGQLGCSAKDKIELYRRMVFNTLLGNLDDHLKNHGCLKYKDKHQYYLSPAFDIVPTPGHYQHAIAVGTNGQARTQENILSRCNVFGLQNDKARAILSELKEIVREYPKQLKQAGMGNADIKILKNHLFVE